MPGILQSWFFTGAARRDCHAVAAQAHLDRHKGRIEVQPVNVIPTADTGLNTIREDIGNNRKQVTEIKCFLLWHCKPCTSLRVQPDRSLQFALNRIYLGLLHFAYQEDSVCGISLLPPVPSCSPGPLIACASGSNAPGESGITQN